MKNLLLVIALIVSQPALAAYQFTGLIKNVYMGPIYGGKVFIAVEGVPNGQVSCDSNADFDYAFDAATDLGRLYLSAILSAYAAQKTIRLQSDDQCTTYPGIPNLSTIWLK